MSNPLYTDEITEWCPHCREYHSGESEQQLQDEIQNLCKEVNE